MNPTVEVEELTVSLTTKDASLSIVRNMHFAIHCGEILALVGKSGCGKSITAKAILRLLPSYASISGKILYQGQNLLELSLKEMQRIRGSHIAFVSQDALTALNPLMRIGDQILETIHTHIPHLSNKEAHHYAVDLLQELGLQEHHYYTYPHQLSGGMRQRTLLAIALAAKPKILIADEPTTSLDRESQQEILLLLKSLQRNHGLGILLISHDLHAVNTIADSVHVMQEGRVLERTLTTTFFSSQPYPYTQRLHRSKSVVQGEKSPLITTQALCKDYSHRNRKQQVLKDLHLAIHEREIVGLVGKSGAGKSTLVRLLLRLEEPTGGSIFFENRSLLSLSKRELFSFRRQCQIVFQDPASSLNPMMTVETILREPLVIHKLRKEKAILEQSLVRVGLDPALLKRYPHACSGGERQRISLARALMLQPRFLICDEALSMLDAQTQLNIAQLLKQLARELHLAILFISHDLPIVQAIADRIVVLERGRIIPSSIDKPKRDREHCSRLFLR